MPKVKEVDSQQFAFNQRAWKAVDGGAVTAAFTVPKEVGVAHTEQDHLEDALYARAASVGIGIDFGTLMSPAQVRAVLVPREGVTADELKIAIDDLFDAAKQEIDTLLASEDADDLESGEKLLDVYESRQAKLISTGTDTMADCVQVNFEVSLGTFGLLGIY